jgi:stage V sporulation protein D (sporulation-specific penicillin-binding protein)
MKGSKYPNGKGNIKRTASKSTGSSHGLQGKNSGNTQDKPNTTKLKRREFILLIVFSAALLFMIYRVGYIQFVKGEEYQKMAYMNQTQKRQISPKRGTIYDRNGIGLAISASVNTVSVNPNGLRDEVGGDESKLLSIANDLAGYLGMDTEAIMAKFKMNSRYEYLKRKIDKDIGKKVREYVLDADIGNIYIDDDSKRYYPNGNLASHVLGFTGVDDQGLNGIELVLDSTLKGVPGKIMNEVDVLGRQISFSQERYVEAIDGYDVYLTIDETIQHFAEKAMDQAILDYNLKRGATAIVMNPNTGDILAMVSKPDFDPNDPDAKPNFVTEADWKGFSDTEDSQLLWQTVFRNKAVMDTYEPGSVFKAITASAAIEEGTVNMNTPEFCKPVTISGHTINCWRAGGHGSEDFLHAVYNSCNPVFVQTGLNLGIEKFYQYVKLFGFQERTGIELQGEPSNAEYKKLWHSDPKEIDLPYHHSASAFKSVLSN